MTTPSSRRGPSSRPLTPRQLKALHLAATGHTHQQIAGQLGIAASSVGKFHTEIFRKLGAKSMPHAVHLAWQSGILRRERHGDHAGYAAHHYRGETPCDLCKAGERKYRNDRRNQTKEQAA
ncbi:response regulator transcription factor [Streptomyces chartreusis]|uniref:response regulator transcription factor n=1 Tax=Streptomyces chartreusis TaxID=1969 RepID=UPI003686E9E2